jgi:hypothetical protein
VRSVEPCTVAAAARSAGGSRNCVVVALPTGERKKGRFRMYKEALGTRLSPRPPCVLHVTALPAASRGSTRVPERPPCRSVSRDRACAVLVGGSNGDGTWRGLITIIELVDPRPYMFLSAVYILDVHDNIHERPAINSSNSKSSFARHVIGCRLTQETRVEVTCR